MSDHKRWLKAQLEERACQSKLPFWLSCIYSIAVSLKRIADKDAAIGIELTDDQQSNLFHQVGNIAWEAGRNFQHGMRTDR